jgi:hypothetical protein
MEKAERNARKEEDKEFEERRSVQERRQTITVLTI